MSTQDTIHDIVGEMDQALRPLVEKYKHLAHPSKAEQYADGLCNGVDVLHSALDSLYDKAQLETQA